MKLIINADDFGMSHTKNIAIDEMMKKNICTNASLVVNMPDTLEAVELSVKNGYSDRISLHLNLTVGKSLTENIRKIKLYYESDQFAYRPIIKLDEQIHSLYISEISEEIEEQMKKFSALGFRLNAIDSHNWIHLRKPIWIALQPLINKYNIQIVRPMWSGYKKPEIASEKWCKYFSYIEPVLLKCSGCKIIEHTSNVEQFLVDEEKLKICRYIEVFTHPDIIDGKILDLSSSYLGMDKQLVINNISKLKKYPKTTVKDILGEIKNEKNSNYRGNRRNRNVYY